MQLYSFLREYRQLIEAGKRDVTFVSGVAIDKLSMFQ